LHDKGRVPVLAINLNAIQVVRSDFHRTTIDSRLATAFAVVGDFDSCQIVRVGTSSSLSPAGRFSMQVQLLAETIVPQLQRRYTT
jgi:hypothetical protein